MAAIIKCDLCGATVHHTNAMHVRVHKLTDATTFVKQVEDTFDVCGSCYEDLLGRRKEVYKTDDNQRTT